MGKKKRGHPDIEELLGRPWCYYCERDFEDLKLLISHQKAKHFKCDRCGRRLNTAGGLSVHMNQVHKESLSSVDNALPNRSGLDVEIFGMEGIPEDVVQQHNQRIIQTFYQEQADRYAATGNPPPGQNGKNPPKKLKVETADDLKRRLAEHRARLAAQKASGGNANGLEGMPTGPSPGHSASPGGFNSPFPPPGGQFSGYPQGVPGYSPTNGAPYQPPQLPSRPGSNLAAPTGLPQRPGYPGYSPGASTVDELVSGASRQGDDIDQMIRRVEAGLPPPKKPDVAAETPTEEAAEGKKSKKDKEKNVKMVWGEDISPEEKMATMARYAFVPTES